MLQRSRAAIGAVLLAGLVLLGGCGDPGDDDAASTASDSPVATPSESTETTEGSEGSQGDGSSTPSESPTSPTSGSSGLPPCAEVWSDGATLPRGYRGCDDAGEAVRADKHTCSFGGALVEYAGQYYAQLGSTINDEGDLAASDGYRQALAACQA